MNIAETVAEFLMGVFQNEYLVVFFISMIPMIEVKGAIPVGIALGLNPWVAFAFSVLSSLIVCPIILFLLRPVLNLLKKIKWFRSFAESLEDLFAGKAQKTERADSEQRSNRFKMLVLFLFVALPLPLTGVWTGSAIAVFMQKKYRYSVIPIVLGCVTQGLIFTALHFISPAAGSWLIIAVSVFVLVSLATLVTQLIVKRIKRKKQGTPLKTDASDAAQPNTEAVQNFAEQTNQEECADQKTEQAEPEEGDALHERPQDAPPRLITAKPEDNHKAE